MKNLWSGKRFGILFSVLLTAFTAYALLDVFVIPRQYALVTPDSETVKLNEMTALLRNTERNAQTSPNADGSDAQTSPDADGSDAQTSPDADGSDAQTSPDANGSDAQSQGADESDGKDGDASQDTSRKSRRPRGRGDGGAFPNPWENADGTFPTPPENADGTFPTPPENADGTFPTPPENADGTFPTPPENADGTFPNPWGNADGAFPKRRESADGSVTDSENAKNGVTESESGVIRSYSDDDISIDITQYRAYNTDIYVADVTLSAPGYLKTALAGNAYGRNIKDKTSAIAAENNAIFAVNGDYYGARNSGYVIRNGTLYRDSGAGGEILAIFADGSFQIVDDREVTAQELLESGAVQALSFGPALVKDGVVAVTEGQEVGKAMVNNPRTAIGVIDNLHYVFVVADGRTGQSEGMSLHELAEFMRELGAKTAYNLDGGGSSTMVFDGEIINRPTTNGNSVQERSVSDIVYIGA